MEETSRIAQEKLNKLKSLRDKGIEPYGGKFAKALSIKDLVDNYKENEEVLAAGRLTAVRTHGKSTFGDIKDSTGKVQFYIKQDTVGDEKFEQINLLDIGDIIGVKGSFFKTRTGESTINVKEYSVLSKSLRTLPEKWHGLKDIETRYRQRYVDLIVNEDVRRVFYLRTKIIAKVREFLDKKGFLEVETPMMQEIPGGATARPFKTHHNALGLDLYLRIAPELFLKKLLVGGFDKVYEINRNFRNEGISTRHNPEFTMLEVYASYWDYRDMIDLTEELISSLAQDILGTKKIPLRDTEVDLTPPWKRASLYDILKENTGKDFRNIKDLKGEAVRSGVEVQEGQNDGDILNNLFEKFVEPKLIQPTFILDYPAILCPLAKKRKDDPELTERFELFLGTQELANAYSELNDPIEQRERFIQQRELKKTEREHSMDEDFLRALEYGMPPAAGLGIGIDRLVMVLTNQSSIRDVILFPQLKPEK